MKKTALIMAGGHGERFWPRSRQNLPKQFLSLTSDGKTLIQRTVERILPLLDSIEDVYISTSFDYKKLCMEQLPQIPAQNIICEPVQRNTAPCIGLSAAFIAKKYEDAVMIVLPSDHLIKYEQIFRDTINEASAITENGDNLVTIGITPTYPEVGYGYIKFNTEKANGKGYSVDHFAEKPSIEVAKEYVSSNEYLWNSGMFVWRVSTIMDAFNHIMPDVGEGLSIIKDAVGAEKDIIDKTFPSFPSISIDYGIMEKSDKIFTIPGSFGWDDVGSWLAMDRIRKSNEFGNITDGNVITIKTNDCIIQAKDKLIACVGLKDLVIVDTDDATLICSKEDTSDIKKVIETLKTFNKNELL